MYIYLFVYLTGSPSDFYSKQSKDLEVEIASEHSLKHVETVDKAAPKIERTYFLFICISFMLSFPPPPFIYMHYFRSCVC